MNGLGKWCAWEYQYIRQVERIYLTGSHVARGDTSISDHLLFHFFLI